MKLDPRYGYYPRWPQDGNDWIHPDDVSFARGAIPSWRIWRREAMEDAYDVLTYGELRIRVLPALWIEVAGEGINIGDWVEVKSRMQQNTYRIARIREMQWSTHESLIRYQVEARHFLVPSGFTREDLRVIDGTPIAPVQQETIGPLIRPPQWDSDDPDTSN